MFSTIILQEFLCRVCDAVIDIANYSDQIKDQGPAETSVTAIKHTHTKHMHCI